MTDASDRAEESREGFVRHRAGLISRMIANGLDLVVIGALGVVAAIFAAGIHYLIDGPPLGVPDLPGWLLGGAESVLGLAYLSAGWSMTGRTFGKQVLGLRVVTTSGRRLRPWRAVARAAMCLVFPIGLLWVLVSRRNMSVHDAVLGTAVVYDWSYRPVQTVRRSTDG